MAIDDSFKQPGSVPFKWEIRPGVPKIQHQLPQKQLSPPKLPSPSLPFHHHRPSPSPSPSFNHSRPSPSPSPSFNHSRPSPSPPKHHQKLKPPPAFSIIYLPSPEPRTRSFRSTPRTRSDRWRFDQPARVRPECVSPGCFPSSTLLKRKDSKRRATTHGPGFEPDYASDLETISRWSVSSRRSVHSFRDSPVSSFSSYQSSPRVVGDTEWAGFGLF